VRAGVDAADARVAVQRAFDRPDVNALLRRPVRAIAAGKAGASMAAGLVAAERLILREALVVGIQRSVELPRAFQWMSASHPLPDGRSVAAGREAAAIARRTKPDELLLILLSGGASSLLALPADGISLDDKRRAIDALMRNGADIHELNTLRKHLSQIKGGLLAATCRGTTLTLAISDVVGDDLSVIGSGPGVADPTTWSDVSAALSRRTDAPMPATILSRVAEGVAGRIEDTPKPGDALLGRAAARVIAGRKDVLDGARRAAESLGYAVVALSQDVTGEARQAAQMWYAQAAGHAAAARRAICVMSAGETTVRVTGSGRGGRNQEFALSLVGLLADSPREALVASIGTDGIDGPTDAAGAMADVTTLARARQLGMSPSSFLDANDAFNFFNPLGDLIRLGPTDTNAGDLQVYLSAAP
jgi:glycerate 2-kinase